MTSFLHPEQLDPAPGKIGAGGADDDDSPISLADGGDWRKRLALADRGSEHAPPPEPPIGRAGGVKGTQDDATLAPARSCGDEYRVSLARQKRQGFRAPRRSQDPTVREGAVKPTGRGQGDEHGATRRRGRGADATNEDAAGPPDCGEGFGAVADEVGQAPTVAEAPIEAATG